MANNQMSIKNGELVINNNKGQVPLKSSNNPYPSLTPGKKVQKLGDTLSYTTDIVKNTIKKVPSLTESSVKGAKGIIDLKNATANTLKNADKSIKAVPIVGESLDNGITNTVGFINEKAVPAVKNATKATIKGVGNAVESTVGAIGDAVTGVKGNWVYDNITKPLVEDKIANSGKSNEEVIKEADMKANKIITDKKMAEEIAKNNQYQKDHTLSTRDYLIGGAGLAGLGLLGYQLFKKKKKEEDFSEGNYNFDYTEMITRDYLKPGFNKFKNWVSNTYNDLTSDESKQKYKDNYNKSVDWLKRKTTADDILIKGNKASIEAGNKELAELNDYINKQEGIYRDAANMANTTSQKQWTVKKDYFKTPEGQKALEKLPQYKDQVAKGNYDRRFYKTVTNVDQEGANNSYKYLTSNDQKYQDALAKRSQLESDIKTSQDIINTETKNTNINRGLIYGGGALGLAGLGLLGYNLLKGKDKKEKKMKKSFNEEFCENKALVSAANTVDMITLIDPVNYSEYSVGLIAKLSNTPYNYVANVMNEVADFNAHFSEEGTDLFMNEISTIYDNFSEGIVANFGEYLSSLANFDEEAAEAKIDDLSELISIIDEKTAKELGTDYVATIIANATDTDVDLLKATLSKYIYSDEIDDYKSGLEERLAKVEEAVNEAKAKTDIAENAVEDAKDVVQESFSEVFIKKDGQYFKFNDAVITVPKK